MLKSNEDDSLNKVPFFFSSRIVSIFWHVSHSDLWKGSRSFSIGIAYSRVPGYFSKEIYS